MPPSMAILVPTHQRWNVAREALRSIQQGAGGSYAVALVDDGSTDGTSEHCLEEFADVEVLHGDGTLWWAGAINVGLEWALASGAETILWINDDNRVERDTLPRLLAASRRLGPRAVVCARVHTPGASPREIWEGNPLPWDSDYLTWQPPSSDEDLVAIGHPPGGQGVLFSAECFRELGTLDARGFPHRCADLDFHLRAMRHGYTYYVVQSAMVLNRPNEPRPIERTPFSLGWAWWLLTARSSPMGLLTIRRLLRRHMPADRFKAVFYPFAWRTVTWVAAGVVRRRPTLHRLVRAASAAKRRLFGRRAP